MCSARRGSNPFGVDVPRHRWDMDQGIADLRSTALTTELRTDGRCGGPPPVACVLEAHGCRYPTYRQAGRASAWNKEIWVTKSENWSCKGGAQREQLKLGQPFPIFSCSLASTCRPSWGCWPSFSSSMAWPSRPGLGIHQGVAISKSLAPCRQGWALPRGEGAMSAWQRRTQLFEKLGSVSARLVFPPTHTRRGNASVA